MTEPADRPTVAILLTPQMRAQLIPPAAETRLAEAARIVAPGEGELSAEALGRLVADAGAAITGWGTPRLDEALLDSRPDLRLVAHAAGSVRQLVPLEAIESGRIEVTHAAIHIGEAVCEFVMAQIFTWLRQPLALAEGMRSGEAWFALRTRLLGRLLGEQSVGLVGAGYIGRMLIRQFQGLRGEGRRPRPLHERRGGRPPRRRPGAASTPYFPRATSSRCTSPRCRKRGT